MVRFDIVGINDCPWFAKAVKLGDEIGSLHSRVEFHHEMLDKIQFKDYCEKMKQLRGWDVKKSPVVFEVLVDPSGKCILIGDCSDFCDFAAMYFDIYYDPTSSALQEMALANRQRFAQGGLGGQDREDTIIILNLAIINAPLGMLELMLAQLLSPISMIPPGVLLDIRVFDEFTELRNLHGLMMEVTDMASPILSKIGLNTTLASALNNCDLLILAEDLSRGETEEKIDWISRVEARIAEVIAVLIDKNTKMVDARVIAGGNGPQCYIAEMIRGAVPQAKVGVGRVVASGQYIAQKAKAELGKIGDIPAGCITRIHAWGWPGEIGAYIEVKDGVLKGADVAVRGPGVEIPLTEEATNSDFIFTKFSKEFLRLQRKCLMKAIPLASTNMPMAESVVTTINVWLASERLTPRRRDYSSKKATTFGSHGQSRKGRGQGRRRSQSQSRAQSPAQSIISQGTDCGGTNPNTWCPSAPYGLAAVLNVGVPVLPKSTFPPGSFMVQPAICVNGRWRPVGLISEKTHQAVVEEVNRLWIEREEFIFRDKDAAPALFPDWEVMNQSREGYVKKVRPDVVPPYSEYKGEGDQYPDKDREQYGEGGYPDYVFPPEIFQEQFLDEEEYDQGNWNYEKEEDGTVYQNQDQYEQGPQGMVDGGMDNEWNEGSISQQGQGQPGQEGSKNDKSRTDEQIDQIYS